MGKRHYLLLFWATLNYRSALQRASIVPGGRGIVLFRVSSGMLLRVEMARITSAISTRSLRCGSQWAAGLLAAGLGAEGADGGGAGTPDLALYASTIAWLISELGT